MSICIPYFNKIIAINVTNNHLRCFFTIASLLPSPQKRHLVTFSSAESPGPNFKQRA